MNLQKALDYIWDNARLLERAILEYRFFDGSPGRIGQALGAYQNADGGFGHALEPDLRAPDSQPLFVEFALHTLYDCGLHAPDLAAPACQYIAAHADLEQGLPALLPSAKQYHRAAHWQTPWGFAPSTDRLAGIAGLLKWQGVQDPWLEQAVQVCLERAAAAPFDDAHTIRTALVLVESAAGEWDVAALRTKLARELFQANYFLLEAPATQYGLTPLAFAPAPGSYLSDLFTPAQIAGHLDDLEAAQEQDGSWPVRWDPPGEFARREWKALQTVNALVALKAYGRLP